MDSTPASLLARAGAGDLIEVRRLLAQRVDPNARDDSGQTALIIAVGEGTEEVVRALLEAGADVNLATPAGTSPLMLAGKLCDPDLVRLLAAHGADIGRFGADAMQHAAVWGHIDTLKTLVEAGVDLTDPDTATVALAEAQHGNHTEAVTYLLSAGAAASLSDLSYSPLSAAVWKGLIDLASIPPLIEAGADPNMAGPFGETPLMFAAGLNHTEAIDMFLAAGADPTARDARGRTAMVWAAERQLVRVAKRLWKLESLRDSLDPLTVTTERLRATRLDEVPTPLTAPKDTSPFTVLYSNHFNQDTTGWFVARGASRSLVDARTRVSDDNNHAVERGPYLVVERIFHTDEVTTRPTNPHAVATPSFRARRGCLLVLAHLPTVPGDSGEALRTAVVDVAKATGWGTVVGLFPSRDDLPAARAAALAQPGRCSVVELADVCTVYEGHVDSFPALIKTPTSITGGPGGGIGPPHSATDPPELAPPPGGASSPVVTPGETTGQPLSRPARRATAPPARAGIDFNSAVTQGWGIFERNVSGFVGYAASALVTLASISLGLWLVAGHEPLVRLLSPVAAGTVLAPLVAGFFAAAVQIRRSGGCSFSSYFDGFRRIGATGVVGVVWSLTVGLVAMSSVRWLWLVVVYGAVSMMFTLPFMMDRSLPPLPAIAASWKATASAFVDSCFLLLVVLLTAMSGVVLAGIGLFVTVPLAACVLAAGYARLVGLPRSLSDPADALRRGTAAKR